MTSSENLIENFSHIFPRVEIAQTKDVEKFNGMSFNAWQQNCILIHDRDEYGNIKKNAVHNGGFCSSSYDLVKNENLFLPIADKIDSLFGENNVEISLKYSKPFEYHLFFEMKGNQTQEIDALYPMSESTNSYTTQIKAAQRNMIGRIICTNGMMTIAEKALLFDVKHTKNETSVLMDMDTLLQDTENLFTDFNQVIEHKEIMNSVNLSAIKGKNNTERFEQIIKGTKFPKRQIDSAFAIAQREARQLNQNLTLWLAYNGLNHILNHDKQTKMTQKIKNETDSKLVNKVHAMALELS